MTGAIRNIHATAIVVDGRGLLFIGPSGIGKSMAALSCLAIARRHNVAAALVADDQVLVDGRDGRIFASCPAAIAGLMEIRGSGIVHMEHVETAPLDLAIKVVSLADTERLPPEDERFQLAGIGVLPMIRLANTATDPLAVIGAMMPSWRAQASIW
ncbi:HPr kinase/phosphorylase [Neorhizobium sp. NCHU2750]|uniref:HPr kinase/phosphorylase n=1 Tax=Neorhizobium sp. NCHU2750 TaxID=1825976 RepID=UPI000E759AF6|nr:serine kinase [Neorhizobium sp. NCHU2750]